MATQQDAVTTSSSVADAAISFALAQVGKPYRWGATGPDSYDCSGLIQTAYRHAGLKLTRTTYTMIHEGKNVTRNALLPGDLIFPNPGHVQLYIGGGKVVEAPQDGIPVRVVPIWGFWQARRVTSPGTGAAQPGTPDAGFSQSATDTATDTVNYGHGIYRVGLFIAGAAVLFVAIKSVGS